MPLGEDLSHQINAIITQEIHCLSGLIAVIWLKLLKKRGKEGRKWLPFIGCY